MDVQIADRRLTGGTSTAGAAKDGSGTRPVGAEIKSRTRRSIWKHLGPLFRRRLPAQLIVQLTDYCNASCPQCGMRSSSRFERSRLSLDDGRRIIERAAGQGVRFLSFTGGEPLLFLDDLTELIRHAADWGIPYIRTGTNGFLFARNERPEFADEVARLAGKLAEAGLYNFWISIDSASAELHERMRGLPGVIEGIAKALPIFHRHGIYPTANLGINRNTGGVPLPEATRADDDTLREAYATALRRFFGQVVDLGFTMVNACYPMSFDGESADGDAAIYQATSIDDVVRFTARERLLLYRAYAGIIPEFRSRLRIFTPRSSLHALARQHAGGTLTYPCHGGRDFFFVDSRDGNTYPCGFRGEENLGKFWDLDLRKIETGDDCRQCDWECFRDPSELGGPFLDLLHRPARFAKRAMQDSGFLRLWLEDLRYYRACDFFDGRRAPDFRKLAKFSPRPSGRSCSREP